MSETVKFNITLEQQSEIEALFNNEELKKYMSAGISNTGTKISIEKKLERQKNAIDILSSKDEKFWSFE